MGKCKVSWSFKYQAAGRVAVIGVESRLGGWRPTPST